MSFSELYRLLRERGLLFVTAILVAAPLIWGGAAFYYRERIENLKEQVNLLREQKEFLEGKLKAPAAFTLSNTPISTSTSPASDSPSPASGNIGVRYPPINNSGRLTKSEVRDLAKFYGLFSEWKVNPHLRFQEGDVSYWYEQGLSERQLKREFESRRSALQRADATGEKIDTQGDLSHKAEQLQSQLPAS